MFHNLTFQSSLNLLKLLRTNVKIRLVFTQFQYTSIANPIPVEASKSPLFLLRSYTG